MERSARVATGESVAFDYELAGLGSRFIAVLVDLTIQVFALMLLVIGFTLLFSQGHGTHVVQRVPVSKLARAIGYGLISLVIFAIFFGYFIVLEWRFGRTPGKALLGLRVVRDGGFPLDFTAAVVRNAVRMVEFSLGFYALSAVSTLLSPFNRRLGDYAAGTLVVRDNRFEREALPHYREGPEDSLVAELARSERELILRYVARRPALAQAARDGLAARIATGVRPKLAASFVHLSDDDLLVHLARSAL